MNEELQQLKKQVAELLEWRADREKQQIAFPVDEITRTILSIPNISAAGLGPTNLTQIYSVTGGGGGTVTATRAYVDTILLYIDGITYEIPFVAQT